LKHIRILARDNGAGLGRSVVILGELLRGAGFEVSAVKEHRPCRFRRVRARLGVGVGRGTINLFLERVWPDWLPLAGVNCLMPNQEWFRVGWTRHLPTFDLILAKTREAERIFNKLGVRTEFTSGTSLDRLDENCPREARACLHLAGRSLQKGTAAVRDLWLRHPEWPPLTIVQHPKSAWMVEAGNIDLKAEVLEDRELIRLQNRCCIHVLPSEVEGFGHSLVEAMSVGAVVVTTNAPPMNEYCADGRGLLAEPSATKPQRLGMCYAVDPRSLEEKVEQALALSAGARAGYAARAREWFVENDRFFRKRLVEVLAGL
jgi:Glycosyl transferases group 1